MSALEGGIMPRLVARDSRIAVRRGSVDMIDNSREELGANQLFKVVSRTRMSEELAEQICTLIRTSQLRPGDRLPSERDLCGRAGVSRITVRSALRVLRARGLIEARPGYRGGTFVA